MQAYQIFKAGPYQRLFFQCRLDGFINVVSDDNQVLNLDHIKYRVNKKQHLLSRNYIFIVHIFQDQAVLLVAIILAAVLCKSQ
jgi:hypothetical protein